MGNLCRLVYTSFRSPVCDDTEIKNILNSCRKNNVTNEITGVLLHSEHRFLQYLEGEKTRVERLFKTIEKDYRHNSVRKRDFEMIDQRIFPSWAMAYKDLPSEGLEFDHRLDMNFEEKLQQLIHGKLDFKNVGIKTLQLFFKTI